jgi:uncharacterized protein (DUF885 family)
MRFLIVLGLMSAAFAQTETDRFYALVEQTTRERLAENPPGATAFLGRSEYDDRWQDLSLNAIARRKAREKERLAAAAAIDRGKLSSKDQLNYDLFLYDLRGRVEREEFPSELLAVDALFNGPAVNIPITIQNAPHTTVRDYENLLARLKGIPHVIDDTIALLSEGVREGVTQPQIVLRDVPAQMENLGSGDPHSSPLFEAFRNFPASVPEAERARLAREASAVLDSAVQPAYRKLQRYLVSEYLPKARTTIARTALRDGARWYTSDLREHSTLDVTAQQIHDIGQAEVRRIRSEMDAVMRRSAFHGDFAAFQNFLRTDPRFYFTRPDDLVTAYRDLCKRIEPELPRLFGKLPRAPYGVRPFPDYRAPSETSARYSPGSAGGVRPGYYVVNTYKLESRPKYEMEALTLHESVPGHHLQISLAQEMEGVPEFRRRLRSTAFTEGWGLYAESLGEELGFYADPYQKFGQLSFEMWRACRLVVDTGMHAMGWSREQAIAFMKDNTALTDQNVVAEVDRYIAWPGQAVAYKLGEMKIRQLRRMAEQQLGARFDVRAFHDALLAEGTLPLDILEARMKDWVARQTSAQR